MSQADPSIAQQLVVHLCDLRSGEHTWSATLAVEGPADAEGREVALFYEGRRLCVSQLDEWGYAIFDVDELPPPQDLTALTHFEVRTKKPAAAYTSKAFHPPVVSGALQDFLELKRAWPADLSLRGAKLSGAALSQATLSGVDFTGADLSGAKLWHANLTGAILRDVDLTGADLTGAELSRADLQGATLTDVTWGEVNLKGADLRNTSGMTLDLLQTWGHVATTSEKQQARLKILQIAQADPSSPHYIGIEQVTALRTQTAQTAQTAQIAQIAQTAATGSRSTWSREAHTSSGASITGLSQDTSNHTQSITSSYRTVNASRERGRERHRAQYVSGEHTFYRSPTQQERRREVEVEEAPAYAPILPPAPELSSDERMKLHRREQRRFERQLLKYQQKRSLRGGVKFSLNMIPHGEFVMGRDEGEPRERPRHKIKMSVPLLVGETLVTQELYRLVMGNDYKPKFSGSQLPAESVSWSAAIDFCNRLSRIEGLSPAYTDGASGVAWSREANGYRLPTEAEWEYFARANTPFTYAGSDELEEVAWFKDNSGGRPQPVAQKAPNAWGLYDVSGNLWEWCFDTYVEEVYHERGLDPTPDPVSEGEGPKVIRGGSWSFEEEGLRVDHRSRLSAKFKTSRIGFRVVRSPKLKSSSGR